MTQLLGKWISSVIGKNDALNVADVEPWQLKIIEEVKPFTMTSTERLLATIGAVDYVVKSGLPGAIVECGVWRGGQMMAVALTLLRLGAERELFLFDTFQGMTEPEEIDKDHAGLAAAPVFNAFGKKPAGSRWCEASLEDVRRNIESTGYPASLVHYVVGPVEETLPGNVPVDISLLRLDTDWYASTKHELLHLYPRVVQHGVVVVDDYGHWQGARLATDEYLSENGIRAFLQRVDYTCRQFVKT